MFAEDSWGRPLATMQLEIIVETVTALMLAPLPSQPESVCPSGHHSVILHLLDTCP
jgi:hypothetical protein